MITNHDPFGRSYTIDNDCNNPKLVYLLKFYHTVKHKKESFTRKIIEFNITSIRYSTQDNKVIFTSNDKLWIPDNFTECDYVEIPSDSKERSNMDMATIFRPIFGDDPNVEVNVERDSFYFKLELKSAKFDKIKKNKMTAKVGHWISSKN